MENFVHYFVSKSYYIMLWEITVIEFKMAAVSPKRSISKRFKVPFFRFLASLKRNAFKLRNMT